MVFEKCGGTGILPVIRYIIISSGLSFLICLACVALDADMVEVRNEPAHVVLRNDRLTLTLSKAEKGAIASLVDNVTQQEFVAKSTGANLFLLGYTSEGKASGKLQWLASQSAEDVDYSVEARGSTKLAKLTFRRLSGRNVTVTCMASVSANHSLVLWQIRVDGTEPFRLEQIHFPMIVLRAPLSDDVGNEAIVAGLTKGGVFRQPSQWHVGSALVGSQPGSLCAQFACYYSPHVGFYSATRDSRGYPKMLVIRRLKNGLEWSWRRYCYHQLSSAFELGYDIAQTTFTARSLDEATDWRDAADIYKGWALKQHWCKTTLAKRDDLPDWLKSGPAMVRFSRTWLKRPEHIEEWLNNYWHKHFPSVPLIVAFWGWEHVSSWISPKYFPPYPSEEAFAHYVRAVHNVGGHPFFWPSGYHWTVTFNKRDNGSFEWDDRADFEKTGRPHAVVKRNGTPLLRKCSWLRGGENAVLCRGDAWTRRWLNNIALEIVKRGGDMVQIDQVVGAASPGGACYSRNHGHPPGHGLWDTEAFTEQLLTMAAECRRVNSKVVIGFEEPQELFIQQVGVQDYRDYQKQRWPNLPGLVPASVFGYLYHEFLPTFQSNPRARDKLGMAYCLINGQVPHIIPQWPVRPSPALVNGGFEEWDSSVPTGWSRVKGWKGKVWRGLSYHDTDVKHSGQSSMRLENRLDSDVVQVSQNVPIGVAALQVGHTYQMRIWFKADELSQPNSVRLAALDDRLNAKGVWQIALAKSADWTEGRVRFIIPTDASFLRIMLHVNGRCKVWLDDAILEEIQGDGTYRTVMRTGLPMEHNFARQWVELFHGEGRPYLLLGRMLRPPKLLAPQTMGESHQPLPPILLNAYRAPDGREAVVAVNVTDEQQQVQFEWKGSISKLRMQPWKVQLVK